MDLLITGASSGIARGLADLARGRGWRLALACRDAAASDGDPGEAVSADVSSEAGASAAIDFAVRRFGHVPDAVANCAGSTLISPIGRTTEAQYRAVMTANLDTAFFVSRAYAVAAQQAKQGGSLLLFSSVVAGIGVANHAAIAAAKGGVESLVRALAADLSGAGVRVNAIAPGLTRTPMTARFLGNEASLRQVSAQYPLGRHGEVADAAALAAFLLSPEAGWITGQVIGLDGGFGAVRPPVKVSA
jgi:NAD(P)-dependent dehydrogenase (short-subunit alcohol dehydrogenase family)